MKQELLNMFLETLQKMAKTLTIMKMKIMVRQICQETKLDKDQTKLIMAVISCESGFDPKAINMNKDGTGDYGICQFNDYWYWKKMRLISPKTALEEPETAVRLMIKRYQQGFLKDWVCYSGGYYKSHLDKA